MDDRLKSRSDVGGHSATVAMWLHAGGKRLGVLQSGEAAIKMEGAGAVPVGAGVLEVVVDGRSHRRHVEVLSSESRGGWVAIRPG